VLPFVFVEAPQTGFAIAAVLTAIGLFVVGAVKSMVTKTNPVTAGFENLMIAGVGGIIAYLVGYLFDQVVS
jgi:VIT1/CCC1 family predicted Fe2+/Mn2+ transporter